jgi:dienelactone hydrolase
MFEYFPGNYVWNLSVCIALESGGQIGEIDAMCRPIREAAARGEDAGTADFMASWAGMADTLWDLAQEDLALERHRSAGPKLLRAALYYFTAERMQSRSSAGRKATYARALEAFAKGCDHGGENCRRVEIPYEGGVIAGLFVQAQGVEGPAPCLVQVNGLDSVKELLFLNREPDALAARGVSSLIIDQPGTGEALRLHDLKAVYDTERWASKVVDWLETMPEVDPKRIGLHGVSLGGYYAPRAVAFEPRFALGVVWGANHNWGEMQRRRLAREGDMPVPHYWDHVRWVWGGETIEEFMAIAGNVTLNGVMEKIRVPFLVTHGEGDRQIPLEYAHQSYDQLTSSPKRTLKIFGAREQGVEHSSLDNVANARDWIADWVAETFQTLKTVQRAAA